MDPKQGRFLGMDPFGGAAAHVPSLHKYIYGDLSPAGNTDPTGEMTLRDVTIVVARVAQNALITTARGGVRILRAARTAAIVAVRTGIQSAVRAAKLCRRQPDKCPFDVPLHVVGGTHSDHATHIYDSQWLTGEHTNEFPSFFLVYRNGRGADSRGEYPRYRKCKRPKPPGKACDEFPYASTFQGGPLAGAGQIVSNKWVSKSESDRQGSALSSFYRMCDERGSGPKWRRGLFGDAFVTVGIPAEPVTFSFCDGKPLRFHY